MLSSPGGGVPPDGRVVQVQYEESQLLMVEHRRSAVGYGLSMVELIASGCASSSCSCKVCFFFLGLCACMAVGSVFRAQGVTPTLVYHHLKTNV